jgi:hypothetical protein
MSKQQRRKLAAHQAKRNPKKIISNKKYRALLAKVHKSDKELNDLLTKHAANHRAEKEIVEKIMKQIYTQKEIDPHEIIYSLWGACCRQLAKDGIEKNELTDELAAHYEDLSAKAKPIRAKKDR